jgi:hypothetical protein
MNDDGSGKHQLVDATQVPGTEYIGDPSVQPNGNEVAFVGRWNQSSYEQNKYLGGAPGFCGGNCEGYYELTNGSVARISPAPFDCGAQPCASWEFDPSVASDGSVGYVYEEWVSEANGYGWSPILGQSALLSRNASGTSQQQWKTKCEGTSSGNAEVTDANLLAVDPANPNEIVYANCQETSTTNCFGLTYVSGYDVFLSGANRSDPSDDVLVRTVNDPNAECLRDARTAVGSLGFSPDGGSIVELHGGSGAGIYTYRASANPTATELMAITGDWIFYDAQYIGANRIGITAGEDANGDGTADHIDLYSIPTSCTPQTCSLATGAGVTNLTGTGNLGADYILNTANFGYTTSTAPLTAVATSGASGGAGGSGGPGGTQSSGGNGAGGGGRGVNGAPRATVSVARTQHLRLLLSKGLTFTLSCAAPYHVRATLVVDGKTAAKLHLVTVHGHGKPKSVVVGSLAALVKQGKHRLTIHVSHRMASRLRRAHSLKLTLKLVVSGASRGGRTLTKTIRITR